MNVFQQWIEDLFADNTTNGYLNDSRLERSARLYETC